MGRTGMTTGGPSWDLCRTKLVLVIYTWHSHPLPDSHCLEEICMDVLRSHRGSPPKHTKTFGQGECISRYCITSNRARENKRLVRKSNILWFKRFYLNKYNQTAELFALKYRWVFKFHYANTNPLLALCFAQGYSYCYVSINMLLSFFKPCFVIFSHHVSTHFSYKWFLPNA